jgi:hypothetical protein
VLLLVVSGSIAIILDDPEYPVEARIVPGVTTSASVATQAAATVSQSVDGLERLRGVLRPSDEPDEWIMNGLEIDVGPKEWIHQARVDSDIDGDGIRGTIAEELQGISGKEVEIWVRFDNTRDDAELFAVEQILIRDPTADKPPWAGQSND